MPSRTVSASRQIPAPHGIVYSILADYRDGHPSILPRRYFSNLVVEAGGVGEGTEIRFAMHVLGTTRRFRMIVREPQPGRVLAEKDLDSGVTTTFTVSPSVDAGTLVTIATALPGRDGFGGRIEQAVTARLLSRIYRQELKQLEALAVARSAERTGRRAG